MRLLIVGSSGTIGSGVTAALRQRHTVVEASRSSPLRVDIGDEASIVSLFKRVGQVDAVVCAAGKAPFVGFPDATASDFESGFADKLSGQISLVLRGLPYVRDGGSFTLISGVLAREPVPGGVVSSTINGGLEAFAAAAATELPRGIRINVVSPTVTDESLHKYARYFPGFESVPASTVAQAFVKSVEGVQTGRTYIVE